MLEALAECAGESGELVREFIPKMLETFEEILTESLERRAERNKRASTEDFDEEEMEALEDEQAAEDEVFDQFAECIGTLLKSFKSNILADIEQLLQSKIAPMFAPERSAEERRIAICIFDDVFEHASEGGAMLVSALVGFIHCAPVWFHVASAGLNEAHLRRALQHLVQQRAKGPHVDRPAEVATALDG